MNRKIFRLTIDIVFLILIIVVTIFVFINSSMDYEASHTSSENITGIIISDSITNSGSVEIVIRKIAHVVEFFVLGVFVIAISVRFHKYHSRPLFGYALFYVLSVAVIDEHIQSFSDRTSSTGDIILDFGGALIGFFVGWIIIKLYERFKNNARRTV